MFDNIFSQSWYKQIPDNMKPITSSAQKAISLICRERGLNDNAIFQIVAMSRWAVSTVQYKMYNHYKKTCNTHPEEAIWSYVIQSRLNACIAGQQASADCGLCSHTEAEENIELYLDRLNVDVSEFRSIDEIIEYIVNTDEEAGMFDDPSGIRKKIDSILYTLSPIINSNK